MSLLKFDQLNRILINILNYLSYQIFFLKKFDIYKWKSLTIQLLKLYPPVFFLIKFKKLLLMLNSDDIIILNVSIFKTKF